MGFVGWLVVVVVCWYVVFCVLGVGVGCLGLHASFRCVFSVGLYVTAAVRCGFDS